MATRDFIGKGWSYPLRFDPSTGGVSKDRGSGTNQQFNRVRMSLRQIIGVRRGELFMNRGFGSSVRDLIFQLDSFNLTDRVNFAVTRAMQHRRYGEQRIFVNSMTVKLDRTTAAADIDMQAVLRSANVESNLVFPFYLRDDERLAAERDIEARTSDPLT